VLKGIAVKIKQFSIWINKEDADGLEVFLQILGVMFMLGLIAGLFISLGLYFGFNILTSI